MKKHAPATLRNREVILAVLRDELPTTGSVLEIAAGSGEHAVFFASALPHLKWVPSDPAPEAIASIAAYRQDVGLPNLEPPVALDASAADWPVHQANALVCINMVHISPWEATEGLFRGAARVLNDNDAPLILYGPYFETGVEPAQSNVQFDESLRARDPRWGIRSLEEVDALGQRHGFVRAARYEMPANNLTMVYRSA